MTRSLLDDIAPQEHHIHIYCCYISKRKAENELFCVFIAPFHVLTFELNFDTKQTGRMLDSAEGSETVALF